MTKFTGLAIAIIILASLTDPLPSVQAQDNPVNLELGGEGATSWNIANIIPGDSGTKTLTLHNVGSVDGFVSLWVSNIISSEGINPESETGNTGEPGELDQYLLLNISCPGLDSNISLPATIDNLPQSASDPDYIKISPLDVDDTITLDWQWQLPVETGNEAQGDSLSFTINYMLEELPAGEAEGVGAPGAPRYYLRVNLWGERSRTPASAAGRVKADLEAISVDEMLTLYIPKGVLAQTEDGRRLREIEVWPMQPPPPPENGCIIGVAYDFSPSGATFDPPIELLINYDPEDLPKNVSSLFIAAYDEEQGWRQLAPISGFVAAVGTATAQVSHFTTFAAIATVKPSAPAPALTPTPAPTPTPFPAPPASTPPLMPAIPFNWPLVGGIIAGVVVVGLGVFFWIRRSAEG